MNTDARDLREEFANILKLVRSLARLCAQDPRPEVRKCRHQVVADTTRLIYALANQRDPFPALQGAAYVAAMRQLNAGSGNGN